MRGSPRFSLRKKLIVIWTTIIFVVMSLIGFVMVFSLYSSIKKNSYENFQTTLGALADSMYQSLVLVENAVLEMAASEGIQNWLKDENFYAQDEKDFARRKEALNIELRRILMYSNAEKFDMVSYAVVFADGNILDFVDIQSVGKKRIYQDAFYAYGIISKKTSTYIESLPLTIGTREVVIHFRKLNNSFDREKQLTIMIVTYEKDIQKKYSDLLNEEKAKVYLVGKDDRIFSSNCGSAGAFWEPSEKEKDPRHYLRMEENLPGREMKFVYLYPNEVLLEKVFREMTFYLMVEGLLIFVCVSAIFIYIMRSTRFIDEFEGAMRAVKEKNYDAKIQRYKSPEINKLGDAFNEMTAEIKELIQNKYEAQLLINEMKIAHLQHQMNPHFLFNVLLTIQINAKKSADETIYKMVSALSVLLRASIQCEETSQVTIKEEMQYTEFYLYLQKMRFEDRLSYELSTDEEIKDYLIPKFIIEPIVENAVLHGVEPIDRAAVVAVKVRRLPEEIHIEVRDNGRGFDVEKEHAENENKGRVGLRNVTARIRHIYGEQYGVSIESEINRGTVVRIVLPLEKEQEDV